MTSRDFCYWLQGYFELAEQIPGNHGINASQSEMIKRHLSLVFKHEIDPSFPAEQQEELNAAHQGANAHLFRPQKPGEPIVRC